VAEVELRGFTDEKRGSRACEATLRSARNADQAHIQAIDSFAIAALVQLRGNLDA
jgi:hypothetical protein